MEQVGLQKVTAIVMNPSCRSTALRVALCVGSVLFVINHGSALLSGQMSRDRWISAMLTYCVPFGVSLHGQHRGDQTRKEYETNKQNTSD